MNFLHIRLFFITNMAYEIERKFLVVNDNYRESAYESVHIIQGYICRESGKTVRIRISDNNGFITIKGASTDNGLSRYEWEKQISLDDANDLLSLCSGGIIDKTRYKVLFDSYIYEVDEFHGDNDGLVIAEVELNDVSDNPKFPDFIGKEVTGDKRYYNSNLLKEK